MRWIEGYSQCANRTWTDKIVNGPKTGQNQASAHNLHVTAVSGIAQTSLAAQVFPHEMATRKAADHTLYHLSPKGFWKKFRAWCYYSLSLRGSQRTQAMRSW